MAKQGQHQRAVKEYNKALKAIPGHVDATVALGAAFANTGALSAAVQQFRTALRADPHHANAAEYLQATQARVRRVEGVSSVSHACFDTLCPVHSSTANRLVQPPHARWTAHPTESGQPLQPPQPQLRRQGLLQTAAAPS